MPPFWYISFADDLRFLGATVVAGETAKHALEEASRRGLNPGGEAMILDVPEAEEPAVSAFLNRLVGKDELMNTGKGASRLGDLPPNERANLEARADCVCEPCVSSRRSR